LDKYCAEQFVIQYHKLYALFNVYGSNQDPSSSYSGVISIFLREILEKEVPEIKIYGDGTQTRDFVYFKDVVQAILLLQKIKRQLEKFLMSERVLRLPFLT